MPVQREIGLSQVKEAPEPEEEKTSEKAKEFFKKIAGEDMEVDWLELKDILDYAMRKELPRASSQSQDSIVTTLLALVCGVVCRDTPLGQAFGYRLNNNILNILAHRYSSKDGMITFDDFMMCAVRLKGLIGQWFACFI
uniref:(California timema) hypothetical protein n=1 Tax=Timema californicum TaxID=61474 RepID=A0A7R9JAI7_TIMCA|nr:unnamed protein product [Timema californicum]